MSNATANSLSIETLNDGPFICDVPVKGSTHIYKGTLVAQHSGGYYVPATTSGAGPVCGVAQHESNNAGADGATRVRIEFMRGYAVPNGTSTDAFSDTSVFGAPVYVTDDHTAADNSATQVNKCMGWFMGFESDGKVRVYLDPGFNRLVEALNTLPLLTDSPASVDALRDNIVSVVAAKLL